MYVEEEQAVVLINYAIAVHVNKNSVKFASAFYRTYIPYSTRDLLRKLLNSI